MPTPRGNLDPTNMARYPLHYTEREVIVALLKPASRIALRL